MAKKRKKEKEKAEEYEFRPPDFSEKEFLKKELKDTKAALYTILYAILFGVIAGLISMNTNGLEIVSFMVVFVGIVTLRYFYSFVKVDTSAYTKKNWAGNLATYFFTFLAIWVLMMNPPFADNASPTIENVKVWVTHGANETYLEYKYSEGQHAYQWYVKGDLNPVTLASTPVHGSSDYTVNISARISDNTGVSVCKISLGQIPGTYYNMTYEGDHIYGSSFAGNTLTTSELRFHFMVSDESGHITRLSPTYVPVAIP